MRGFGSSSGLDYDGRYLQADFDTLSIGLPFGATSV